MFPHKMGWPYQKLLYPKRTWARYTDAPKAYLTFDDGPIPEVTEFVLDELAKYGAKATFFCVGDNIRKHPHIFARILAEGHSVGNHTFNHLNGWKTEHEAYLENVDKCQQAMLANGCASKQKKPLFRPPYGLLSSKQAKTLLPTYEIIMWDVLTGDFSPNLSPEACLKAALAHTEMGSIIVFHDNIKAVNNLYYALPKFLEHFHWQGWVFEGL